MPPLLLLLSSHTPTPHLEHPQVEKKTFAEEVNNAFKEAANGPMKGVLAVCEEPLVSVDFRSVLFSFSERRKRGRTVLRVFLEREGGLLLCGEGGRGTEQCGVEGLGGGSGLQRQHRHRSWVLRQTRLCGAAAGAHKEGGGVCGLPAVDDLVFGMLGHQRQAVNAHCCSASVCSSTRVSTMPEPFLATTSSSRVYAAFSFVPLPAKTCNQNPTGALTCPPPLTPA